MIKLRYEEETALLRGIIFKVRNELGGGWSEEIYHQAFVHMLHENGVPVVSKPRRWLLHRGAEVHLFEPDLIVWDKIVLELKALPYQKKFTGEQFAQIIHYLKFWQMDLGLLVNFGPSKVHIQRVIWGEPDMELDEEYDKIRPFLTQQDKTILREICHHIRSIAHQYGLGFPEAMYRKLIAIELNHNRLSCISDVHVTPLWNGRTLPGHTTNHLLVADNYLLRIRSMLEFPTVHDFTSTQTYLHNLGLQLALVVNFGQKQLQIYGVKAGEPKATVFTPSVSTKE